MPSRDREAATRMAEKLTAALEKMGMDVTAHDVGPVSSCTLEAVWGADRPARRCCSADIMTRPTPPGGKCCPRH